MPLPYQHNHFNFGYYPVDFVIYVTFVKGMLQEKRRE